MDCTNYVVFTINRCCVVGKNNKKAKIGMRQVNCMTRKDRKVPWKQQQCNAVPAFSDLSPETRVNSTHCSLKQKNVMWLTKLWHD